MPSELTALADRLATLYDEFPKRGSIGFKEPNVTLVFEIGPTGGVGGRYSLQDDVVDGLVLQGIFAIDQSYLPGLVRDIRAFVQAVAPAA